MIVKMFQPRFTPLVESGTKRQTIRPVPKRLPLPRLGDTLSLRCWTGKPYRSKQRILRSESIVNLKPVRIEKDGIFVNGDFLRPPRADVFARKDGFSDWLEMREWFIATHGLPFTGILIEW